MDRQGTAIDAAMSFELATVEVVRRKSDEGSDLLAAHLPELWQESDQSEGQRRTHAAHRGQQFIALRENGIGSDYLGHAFVEQMDIGLKPREATFVEAPQYSILNMSGLALDRDMLVAKLPPHGDGFGEPFSGGGTLNSACMQPLDQLGPPGGVVIHRKALSVRQHLDVQTLLSYVNSTVAMLCHLRAPSLLMRAGALATVREWKK